MRALFVRAPEVQVTFSTNAPSHQADALLNERLDLAFVAFAPWAVANPALQAEPLVEEPMFAIVAHDHPLAQVARVSLHDLAGEPFLALSSAITPGLMAQQLTAFHERGLSPPRVQEVGDPQTLFSLVAAGAGASLHMASYRNLRRDVAFVPLEDDPAPRATLLMVWRREDERPLLHLLLDTVRSVAGSSRSSVVSDPAEPA